MENPFIGRGGTDIIKNSDLFILDLQMARGKYNLTPKEAEVAYWAGMGGSNIDIADKLNIALETVSTHLKQVYQELGISSSDGMAICRNKLLPMFLISGVVKLKNFPKVINTDANTLTESGHNVTKIELDPHFLIDEGAAQTKYHLTPQETQVSYLLAVGNSTKEIAEKLYLSDSTIKTHLLSVFRKMKFSVLNGKKGSNQAKLLPKFLMDGVIGFNG